MKYGYARVSTRSQSVDGNSLEAQREAMSDCDVIYEEYFTGTKLDRPEFSKLLETVKKGDTIVVTKLDRLSRSASEGIKLIDSLIDRGVNVHILNMGLMDNTPTGKLIRNVMFAFSEFERDMIVERTQEGRAVARMKPGYKEGRPRVDIPDTLVAAVKAGGMTITEACKRAGVSRRTWYNHMEQEVERTR